MLKSRIVLNFNTLHKVERSGKMKIYDFNGKKNICGNRIREARFKRRLTQTDLAAQMQINGVIIERDSILRIEIGTRFVPDYELKVFSKVLKVELSWLLSEEDAEEQ